MNKHRQKGYKLEHFLEKFFNENGIEVKRRGLAYEEDLIFIKTGEKMEVKNRKNANLSQIYEFLGENDYLAIKQTSRKHRNRPILIVLRLEKFLELLKNQMSCRVSCDA